MEPPSGISTLYNFVPEPIKRVFTELSTQWASCEERFQNWTEKTFRPEHAEKINKLFSALPVIALTLILPWKLSATIIAIGYIADIAYPFDRTLYNTIVNGIGVGSGLLALSSTFQFLSTFNPLELLSAFIYGSISTTILPKGNLFA